MDLRHIRAFIAVADALSVTRAAERLHISQPPLSRHIHQLEYELGLTLFVRHRHGVTLTEAGQRLLERARTLDRAAAEFIGAAREVVCGDTGTLRVGIGWGLWDVVLKVRQAFGKRYPNVVVEARDAFCYTESDEQLRSHTLDLAFARPPFDAAFQLSAPLRYERIQAVIQGDSPCAARESVRLRDLAAYPLLLWDRHIAPTLYDRIFELYAIAGITPTTVPTPGAGPYNHAGLMLVASGQGVYLGYGVPLAGPNPLSGVAVKPVSDSGATIDVRVVSRKGETSPLVARFLDCVAQVFPDASAPAPDVSLPEPEPAYAVQAAPHSLLG
jgi:DNA-binding transcriptional LysR family regulator